MTRMLQRGVIANPLTAALTLNFYDHTTDYEAKDSVLGPQITTPDWNDYDVNVISGSAWLSIDKIENDTIYYDVTENDGEEREGEIEVTSDYGPARVFTLTQTAEPEPEPAIYIDEDFGSYTFETRQESWAPSTQEFYFQYRFTGKGDPTSRTADVMYGSSAGSEDTQAEDPMEAALTTTADIPSDTWTIVQGKTQGTDKPDPIYILLKYTK